MDCRILVFTCLLVGVTVAPPPGLPPSPGGTRPGPGGPEGSYDFAESPSEIGAPFGSVNNEMTISGQPNQPLEQQQPIYSLPTEDQKQGVQNQGSNLQEQGFYQGSLNPQDGINSQQSLGIQAPDSLQNQAYLQQNPAFLQQNPAYLQQNPAFPQQNPAYLQQNPAFLQQNSASLQQNPAFQQQNPAFLQQNPSLLQQNPASLQQNPASLQQNPASLQQNPAFLQQNPAYLQQKLSLLQQIQASVQQNQAYLQQLMSQKPCLSGLPQQIPLGASWGQSLLGQQDQLLGGFSGSLPGYGFPASPSFNGYMPHSTLGGGMDYLPSMYNQMPMVIAPPHDFTPFSTGYGGTPMGAGGYGMQQVYGDQTYPQGSQGYAVAPTGQYQGQLAQGQMTPNAQGAQLYNPVSSQTSNQKLPQAQDQMNGKFQTLQQVTPL